MCGGPEQSNTVATCQSREGLDSTGGSTSEMVEKSEASEGEANNSHSCLLELSANNDLAGIKYAVEQKGAKVDEAGVWYGRQNGTNQMVLEQRTPAMIASLYGSLDVLNYILDCYSTCGGDINKSCGSDGSTALHCAAAGGSTCAVDTVNLLLSFGANLNALDAQGRRPADVVIVSPRLPSVKVALERLLKGTTLVAETMVSGKDVEPGGLMSDVVENGCLSAPFATLEDVKDVDGTCVESAIVEIYPITTSSSSFSSSPDGSSPSFSSPSSSPKSPDTSTVKAFVDGVEKTREYPVDPSLPDIKNSIYATDEFRMFSFKVRPCSRAYSHDWTECPFVHPGENARRRDPRRYHYSCVPCPDFRKGVCRRGDTCEYAHGVFECWLHPAQYRTRLCKDGTSCARRVCFFAHTTEELRPLYVSTGSAVPSPRTSSPLDMASMSPPLAPASPSSLLMMTPFSPSNPPQSNLSTPPMSPSSSANSLGGTWQQPSVPSLHLPGVSLHSSRLRAALNARDLPPEELTRLSDFEGQLMSELTSLSTQALSTQARLNAAVAASGCGSTSSRAGKYRNMGIGVAPTNLEDLFASEMVSSPRAVAHESALLSQIGNSVSHDSALLSQISNQMQSHKAASIHSQLQSQLQPQLSSQMFSHVSTQMQLQLQNAVDSQLQGLQSPCQSSSFSPGSLGRVSSVGLDVDRQSSIMAPLSPAMAAARAAAFAQRDKRSYSSRDLGSGSSWSDWGSPTGKPEWGVHGDDLGKFRKSASFGFRGIEEPDVSWVQKLVKEGPTDIDAAAAVCSTETAGNVQRDCLDHSVLGSWMEQMHLDQIVAIDNLV